MAVYGADRSTLLRRAELLANGKPQSLGMLALGVIYSAGLMLVGLELGLLIGLMAGVAAIVPYMGFIVGIGAAMIVYRIFMHRC